MYRGTILTGEGGIMCREELYRRGREGSRVERNYTDEGGSDHV